MPTSGCSAWTSITARADNKPYPYIRAEASNKEFVGTFEELLREVWIGIDQCREHQRHETDRR